MKKFIATLSLTLAMSLIILADGEIPAGGYQGCSDPNVDCHAPGGGGGGGRMVPVSTRPDALVIIKNVAMILRITF